MLQNVPRALHVRLVLVIRVHGLVEATLQHRFYLVPSDIAGDADHHLQTEDQQDQNGELYGAGTIFIVSLFRGESFTYRNYHTVILPDGAAATEKCDDEDDHADDYEEDRCRFERRIDKLRIMMISRVDYGTDR